MAASLYLALQLLWPFSSDLLLSHKYLKVFYIVRNFYIWRTRFILLYTLSNPFSSKGITYDYSSE